MASHNMSSQKRRRLQDVESSSIHSQSSQSSHVETSLQSDHNLQSCGMSGSDSGDDLMTTPVPFRPPPTRGRPRSKTGRVPARCETPHTLPMRNVDTPSLPRCIFNPDSRCSELLQIDFQRAPRDILNCGINRSSFPIEVFTDRWNLLQPTSELVHIMDGASKCMRVIPFGDTSLFTQPHEGPTWSFVGRCIGAAVPLHIEMALYFFYRLCTHIEINGLTEYVVPTPNLQLRYDRRGGKRVVGVTRTVASRASEQGGATCAQHDNEPFSFERAAQGECSGGGSEAETVCAPLTIRMGFTGALYQADGGDQQGEDTETQQDLFCVLYITPLRNVDLLSYIHECFLSRSKATGPDSKHRDSDVVELEYFWRTLLQYEATENLKLGDSHGVPFSYSMDSGGVLGADMLLSVLQIPIKIHEIVKTRCLPGQLQSLNVMGFPSFDFTGANSDFRAYVSYLFACVRQQAAERRELVAAVEKYNNVKPTDRALFENRQLRSPGGWPLRVGSLQCGLDGLGDVEEGFTEFGLPPLPIMLSWFILKSHAQLVTFDSFKLNSGSIPHLATMSIRRFLAFDVGQLIRDLHSGVAESDVCRNRMIEEKALLIDKEIATPLLISLRYYGPQANPLQNLVTAGGGGFVRIRVLSVCSPRVGLLLTGCLRSWWTSMRDFVHRQRDSGELTPLAASGVFHRYISSCLESHRGMILSKSYRSLRIEQVRSPVELLMPLDSRGSVLDECGWGHVQEQAQCSLCGGGSPTERF